MIENIRLSFQGLWSHKMRSFLTMLGVIIGIASIITIVSTIKGSNDLMMKNIIGSGNNVVEISLTQGGGEADLEYTNTTGIVQVPESLREEIRGLKNVTDATFYLTRTYIDSINCGNEALKTEGITMAGVDSHYFPTYGYVIKEGRLFSENDYKKCNKSIILTEEAAEIMFAGKDPIGTITEIKGEPFQIIGVVKEAEAYQPVITSYQDYMNYNGDTQGKIFIPDTAWPILYKYDEPQSCAIRATSTNEMSDAGKKATDIINGVIRPGNTQFTYKAIDLVQQARKEQQLNTGSNLMLILVASIALLVGGIGVMNIMLVSVTERTNEIGLKKALGAKKKVILIQFLTESAVLTSIGGVIGVIAGLILAQILSKLNEIPVAVSIPAIIVSVGFSMVIGIVFGMLPSLRASQLNPIDALRHE